MVAINLFSASFTINDKHLTKDEMTLLEAEVFTRIYKEFMEIIKDENKDYFRLLKSDYEKEKSMIETNFIRCIINDILATKEYTLPGIACYTDTPEEIIFEIASGQNTNPTFYLSQKVIDLHRSVRPQLYSRILSKIQSDKSVSAV